MMIGEQPCGKSSVYMQLYTHTNIYTTIYMSICAKFSTYIVCTLVDNVIHI